MFENDPDVEKFVGLDPVDEEEAAEMTKNDDEIEKFVGLDYEGDFDGEE